MKKRTILGGVLLLIVISVLTLCRRWDSFFQRGNPIPYLMAAAELSEENTYAAVDDGENIYISIKGECPQLFADFQEANHAEFVEQAGSGYIFTNGTENLTISSEIYWGRYTVWTLPIKGNKPASKQLPKTAVYSFRFNLSDGTAYELVYISNGVKNGVLRSPTGDFCYFTSADLGGPWFNLNEKYEAAAVEESELPG